MGMTRLMRPAAVVLLVATLILPVAADQAKSWYLKGQDAEARQNYEKAYDDYKQAYDLSPKNLRYRAAFERLRFLAGASHVHRGKLLREAGKLEEALAEFQKAAEIDPSSFIAQQEMQQTQKAIDAAKAPGPRSQAPPQGVLQRRLEEAQGPVELAAFDNAPITLMSTDDSKKIYETIGRLAGINVLFDPEYTSRLIRIELNGVTLQEALEVIQMESKTFYRPVTPNTIFVAQDNPSKRKEIEQSAVKTFYLSNLSQPTEMQDVVNTLHTVLEIQRVQPLTAEGAIVVRGTPDQLALAQKVIEDLDKAKPEVVVDVAILQVNRDKAHTLGINPPTSATVALQNNLNTTTTSTTGTTTSGTNTSGTPNQINFNSLASLNATDFTVTIPSATASALFSDSDTRVVQNPQVRSIDGQKASLKIGQRVPIASGSFSSGIGGVGAGISPLVNTQFQYLDVGVNIDITPKIHPEGDVSLKVVMNISSVAGQSNIGGITQPIISQNLVDNEIRLKDGEVSLLGGMFEDSNTRSLTGIPGLAQIPFLKYLFSQTQTDHSQNEIVFVLIPHVVRETVVNDLNERTIEVGTANAIQLRRVRPLEIPPAAAPAQNPISPSAPTSQNAAPAAASAAPQRISAPAVFSFDPPAVTQAVGSTFAVNILLSGAQNVYLVPLEVKYDPKLLQVVGATNGGLLSQDGQAVTLTNHNDEASGTLQITATRPPGANGVNGQGSLVTVTFQAKAAGQGNLAISKGGARDPGMQAITVTGAVASVTIK